jgi:lipopolysaccharide transport system ATP-binding protein
MSERIAVRLVGVGKMYRLFASRLDNLLDALGLGGLAPWRPIRYREFWALRGIDLELYRGDRLGIIGRNGAGKSTVLKLITGSLAPTEGRVEVYGKVQALIDAGGGFHPEFTGYENIRAALTYQGLGPVAIREAEAEIAEFTELGDFLEQPLKTYSLGMQARLAFATATAIRPEILVIDEVLGAGDAYFFARSLERTRQLVESGASVLIVSHALDHIVRFCDTAIWLERGRIVKQGASLEVVKAYEQHVRLLEDRRLKAKNRKVRSARYRSSQHDNYGDTVAIRLEAHGGVGAACEVREVVWWSNEEVEERLLVGNAQDADSSHAAFVVLESTWSSPRRADHGLCRALEVVEGGPNSAAGTVAFNLYSLFEDAEYSVGIDYRCRGCSCLVMEVTKNGVCHSRSILPSGEEAWTMQVVALGRLVTVPSSKGGSDAQSQVSASAKPQEPSEEGASPALSVVARRWPGEGSLMIKEVLLMAPTGGERAVFEVGTPMTLVMEFFAARTGRFDVVPVAVLYRIDGIRVSSHIGECVVLVLNSGEQRTARLSLGPLNLGDGRYVFSVALYRRLSALEPVEVYDLIDRSYEFEVVGNPPLEKGVFRHSGTWTLA